MTLDARLIDEDVIALLQTTYPVTEYSLQDIQGNDAIMEQYFTCVNHGRAIILSHITGETFSYNKDIDNGAEEEDEESTDEEDDTDDSSGEDDDSGDSDNGGDEEEETGSALDE